MDELNNLKDAVAKVSADVDAFIARPAGVPPAEVQALADQLNDVHAKATAALEG